MPKDQYKAFKKLGIYPKNVTKITVVYNLMIIFIPFHHDSRCASLRFGEKCTLKHVIFLDFFFDFGTQATSASIFFVLAIQRSILTQKKTFYNLRYKRNTSLNIQGKQHQTRKPKNQQTKPAKTNKQNQKKAPTTKGGYFCQHHLAQQQHKK